MDFTYDDTRESFYWWALNNAYDELFDCSTLEIREDPLTETLYHCWLDAYGAGYDQGYTDREKVDCLYSHTGQLDFFTQQKETQSVT